MEYDFKALIDELAHVEKTLKACKTDEERVFAHMYLMNMGKTIQQAAGAAVNDLTGKCVERVAPLVK